MVAPSGGQRSTPPELPVGSPGTIEPKHRSNSVVAFVVTALILMVAFSAWLRSHTPQHEAGASGPINLTGTLVYSVPDGDHWSRLWRWDLATDQVDRGPRIPRAVELVHVSGGEARWVGVTSQLPSGRLQASVLRSLRPRGHRAPIVSGDIVAWDPQGRSVAAVHSGSFGSSCERRVSIRWAKPVPPLAEQKYLAPALCGDVLSLGLDDTVTYFTLFRDGRVGIYLAGVHRIHLVLPGHVLISMSAVSDMVVVPASSLPGMVPLQRRPELAGHDLPEARLYFQGVGANLLTPYGVGADRFAIDEVLAWSPDGLIALTEGAMGHQRGLFELSAGPASGVRTPTYVGPVGGVAHATFTADGTPIVVTQEGVFAIMHDEMVPLVPPEDAPAPDGPLVWLA
jgi:hypothetical protein